MNMNSLISKSVEWFSVMSTCLLGTMVTPKGYKATNKKIVLR